MEEAAIEKNPTIPLRLEHPDLKINVFYPKVESTSLSSGCWNPELLVWKSRVAAFSSAHVTEASPVQNIAHTGPTQELEDLNLSDDPQSPGHAEDDFLNIEHNHVLNNKRAGDDCFTDSYKNSIDFVEIMTPICLSAGTLAISGKVKVTVTFLKRNP